MSAASKACCYLYRVVVVVVFQTCDQTLDSSCCCNLFVQIMTFCEVLKSSACCELHGAYFCVVAHGVDDGFDTWALRIEAHQYKTDTYPPIYMHAPCVVHLCMHFVIHIRTYIYACTLLSEKENRLFEAWRSSSDA
jgi:hypothetical protein